MADRLLDAQGIALELEETIAPALGMSYGGRIAILPGQQPAEEFSTLFHGGKAWKPAAGPQLAGNLRKATRSADISER